MPDSSRKNDLTIEVVSYLNNLLSKSRVPPPQAQMAAVKGFEELCAYIKNIKEVLLHFSNGNFEHKIQQTGATAGFIKALQANIRHLVWQCYAVADGDLDQQVEFLGELSKAFNRMTEALAQKQEEILNQQKDLRKKTKELETEVKKKEKVEAALRASEEMYREKSLRDHLTGLYNRGYFYETVTREFENLKRAQVGYCCLVMIDIDYFKQFNDTYGHLCGDQALKMAANTISGALRKSDILARYGGEEFSAYLASSNIANASVVAERVRAAIEGHPSPTPCSTQPITVSIGLCHVDLQEVDLTASAGDILKEALKKADDALYMAKDHGRNMVWATSLRDIRNKNKSV